MNPSIQNIENLQSAELNGNCCHCVYWQMVLQRSELGLQDEGLCRRRAPSAIPCSHLNTDGQDATGEQGLLTAWPRTFGESDWCGDYKAQGKFGGRERPEVSATP